MRDYLLFRKFLTPILIELLFWLGVGLCVANAIASIIFSAQVHNGYGIFGGIVLLLVGPIFVRVLCEVIMAIFGIHDALRGGGRDK